MYTMDYSISFKKLINFWEKFPGYFNGMTRLRTRVGGIWQRGFKENLRERERKRGKEANPKERQWMRGLKGMVRGIAEEREGKGCAGVGTRTHLSFPLHLSPPQLLGAASVGEWEPSHESGVGKKLGEKVTTRWRCRIRRSLTLSAYQLPNPGCIRAGTQA